MRGETASGFSFLQSMWDKHCARYRKRNNLSCLWCEATTQQQILQSLRGKDIRICMENRVKAVWPILLALSAIFVAVSVIIFMCVNHFGAKFWCGYIFILISWGSIIFSILVGTEKLRGEKRLFVTAPRVLLSCLYFLVQLVFGIAVIGIPFFSIKAALIVQILFFTCYLCTALALFLYERKNC